VEAYVIVSNDGEVLRKMPGLSTEKAKEYGDEVMKLARKARHVVRDLDPKVRLGGKGRKRYRSRLDVCLRLFTFAPRPLFQLNAMCAQNELDFLRIRTREKEALIAQGNQEWRVSQTNRPVLSHPGSLVCLCVLALFES
jgi:hypothetical protein